MANMLRAPQAAGCTRRCVGGASAPAPLAPTPWQRASGVARAATLEPAAAPTLIVKHNEKAQVRHSLTAHGLEVVRDLDHFAATELTDLLKPVEKCWQCQDFMPDPSSPTFADEIRELQRRTGSMPDEHLLVLVGDMITEEALPTYMSMLNTLDGTRDETGASESAWAVWTRKWTAEENRHGDAMNKYLWLTGRVNMRAVEVTIQNLIGSGMDPGTENNPYLGFIYTSFQERATKIAHGNTARFAKEHGDEQLSKLCGLIAADEGRHEIAYQRIVDELFKRDPDGTLLAFEKMMRRQIVMPAHYMDDMEHKGRDGRTLFDDYSAVADRAGVYTAFDYASIMEHLITRWGVEKAHFASGEAAAAQEWLVKQPERIRKLAAFARRKRDAADAKGSVHAHFSWLFNKEVLI